MCVDSVLVDSVLVAERDRLYLAPTTDEEGADGGRLREDDVAECRCGITHPSRRTPTRRSSAVLAEVDVCK